MKKALNTAVPEVHIACLDYDNFNIQHTPRAMKQVFKSLLKAGQSVEAHPDWVWAVKWVIESLENQSYGFVGCIAHSPVVYPCLQGMYSGTRATDLYNTCLNLAYRNIAVGLVSRVFSIVVAEEYAVHQGDDSYLACANVSGSLACWLTLRGMGLAMQVNKQMIGGGVGEFLRILYSDGGTRGVPARTLINVLLRPLQQSTVVNPIENIPSLHDNIMVLRRRGLSEMVCQLLYSDQLAILAKVNLHKKDYNAPTIPLALVFGRKTDGGMGAPPPGCRPIRLRTKVHAPYQYSRSSKNVLAKLPNQMAKDSVKVLSARAGETRLRAGLLEEAAARANYGAVLSVALHKHTMRDRYETWCAFLNKHPWLVEDSESGRLRAVVEGVTCVEELIHAIELLHASMPAATALATNDMWTLAAVRHNVRLLAVQLKARLGKSHVTGPTTVNARLHAALAATTFKSLATTLVALGGDDDANIAYLVTNLMSMGGSSGLRSAQLIAGMKASEAMRSVRLSMKDRLLQLDHMMCDVNPDLIIESSDRAMDLIWPLIQRSLVAGETDMMEAHLAIGSLLMLALLTSSDKVMATANRIQK